MKKNLPLHVCFCWFVPKSELSTLRRYSFMLEGLKEVAEVTERFGLDAQITSNSSSSASVSFSICFDIIYLQISKTTKHLYTLLMYFCCLYFYYFFTN